MKTDKLKFSMELPTLDTVVFSYQAWFQLLSNAVYGKNSDTFPRLWDNLLGLQSGMSFIFS